MERGEVISIARLKVINSLLTEYHLDMRSGEQGIKFVFLQTSLEKYIRDQRGAMLISREDFLDYKESVIKE